MSARFMLKREKVKVELFRTMRAMVSRQSLAIWAGAFLLSVLAGPFGTFRDLDLGPRAWFWGMVVTASIVANHLSRGVATLAAGEDRPALFDAVAVAAMTMLLSPLIFVIGRMIGPALAISMASFADISLCVFSVAMIMLVLGRVLAGIEPHAARFGQNESGSLPDAARTREPRLMRRLEADIRGEILRLSAKDHHVEIATRQGTQMLRMRLGDAIGEMEPIEGHCAHRSHWVTRGAILRVEREGGHKTWLILQNGDRVPVSRRYRPDLEAAGIF